MDNLKYTEILAQNKILSKNKFNKTVSIKLLSNVTINSFKELLEFTLRTKKLNPEIEFGNFDNIVQDSLSINNEDIVFVFYELLNIVDNVSEYFELLDTAFISELEIKICNEIDIILDSLKNTPTVFFNTFSIAPFSLQVTKNSKLEIFTSVLNQHLSSKNYPNLVLVNIDKILFELGRVNTYDFRFYLSSKAPYTITFFKSYLKGIEPNLKKISGSIKKAIIFDCDNTLWKGIIGEDGIENLDMSSSSIYGKPFYDVQSIAKYLSKNGVLVGLCSKNNPEDVEEVFNNRKDLQLTNDDIVVKQVNWNDKSSNLLQISKILNIGIDSIVFVDDSDYEVNLIKELLPEVETLQVPKNTYLYRNTLLDFLNKNFNFAITKEDLEKTNQYKVQLIRDSEKSNYSSLDDYIANLKIKVFISKDDETKVERISQLTQKTNQFNLTTIRYTESEIFSFINSPNYNIYTGTVSDKFGDSGLTILSIVQINDEKSEATIDSFLMSCRIIGRNIEIVFLDFILHELKEAGIKSVKAFYSKTQKNSQVIDFYDKFNFDIDSSDENSRFYSFSLLNLKPNAINYIQIN
jgi:FkbH-like protein